MLSKLRTYLLYSQRMRRNIPRRCPRLLHHFEIRYASVVAKYTKGNRNTFETEGNYEECQECGVGRFVPRNKDLHVVECEFTATQ